MENKDTVRPDILVNGYQGTGEGSLSPVYPEDEMLAERLEWFKDMKLGVIFHWGLYTVEGTVESWPLSEEDDWARTRMQEWGTEIEAIRARYWKQSERFNPVNFEPEKWAEQCRDAGFKYCIFTTKHHEGFSLFDTQESDFKVTGSQSPFKNHPKSDVTKAVFDAFREEGFGVGAYYSKPDWYSPYYWLDNGIQKNQGANYDIQAQPETWNKYVSFVHNQIEELTTGYGKIDMLWLDGGWCGTGREDLRMDELVEKARENQPDLIVVDRASGQRHENYVTPEQEIPDWNKLPEKAWESCISFGHDWGYVANDDYKTAANLVDSLVRIVARGGNLIIGLGPQADGTLSEETVNMMNELGPWMSAHGEGIYGTRPYRNIPHTDDWQLTTKETNIYAFCVSTADSSTNVTLEELNISDVVIEQAVLMSSGEVLTLDKTDEGTKIILPKSIDHQMAIGIKLMIKA